VTPQHLNIFETLYSITAKGLAALRRRGGVSNRFFKSGEEALSIFSICEVVGGPLTLNQAVEKMRGRTVNHDPVLAVVEAATKARPRP
jgi:hypothetical protein